MGAKNTMKMRFKIIGLMLLVATLFGGHAHGKGYENHSHPALLDTIYADYQEIETSLIGAQTNYYTDYGNYYQGIATHSTPPADGNPRPPNKNAKPPDQSESWREFEQLYGFDLPATMKYSLQVDAYISDGGHGYIATVEATVSGIVWIKHINYGGETYNQIDWYIK